ncbi:hypothetical protein FZEAL_9697 [Fusarium zealandicum]|uniref:Uncharacterized protein n=1 Tax=Fusarium zealandicum TaxID=1053134 RepID=A0A8H4U9K0_9HYPO|nr:hypothetical protein FZEAL_9697 [Fusarium zealandicum]
MAGKDRFIRALSLLVLGLSTLVTPVSASWTNPLEHFYSQYSHGLQDIIQNNCSDTYALYLADRRNVSAIRSELRIFGMHSMNHEMIECILENSPELVKSKMAAAAIVLGLAPTIIASLGVRPQDTALLSVVGRRHMLAFAVAVGSPAINAYRASEYATVIDSLRDRSLKRPSLIRKLDPFITAFSYILAAASIANIGELTYRLGARATFSIVPDAEFMALLWASLGVLIHFLAGLAMWTRVSSRVQSVDEDVTKKGPWPVSVAKGQIDIMTRRSKLIFTVHPEFMLFSLLSLITTVFTGCHIIFGTLVFSSILFVSVNDSLSIVARLMASAIVTRVIITSELLALRESVEESVDSTVAHNPARLEYQIRMP